MKRMLTSCFGLGFLPIAPGTWGSMPSAGIFAGICFFVPLEYALGANSIAMVLLIAIGSFACVKYSPEIIKLTGKKDPGEVVADELAGQAVTFIGVSATGVKEILIISAAGFLLFRLFDIIKPSPARNLEKLPAGWGILADDLMAGVYAAIVLHIFIHLVLRQPN